MATTLPSADPAVDGSLLHPDTTSAEQKLNFAAVRNFAADLLGTDSGDKAAARTVLGAAASGANGDITSLTALASVNGGQLAGMRNKILNGNFAVNQEAKTAASTAYAAGVYIRDQWKAGAGGCTLSFATVNNVTTATITAGTLVQPIEGANLQSGTHALSWTGTAQGRINGGAYGASGLTGTATGGTNMDVEFGTGTLAQVQLEPGSTATAFEQRPYGLELALCQRYCWVGPSIIIYMAGQAPNSTTVVSGFVSFPNEMRTTPTVTHTISVKTDAGSYVSTSLSDPSYVTSKGINYVVNRSAASTSSAYTVSVADIVATARL